MSGAENTIGIFSGGPVTTTKQARLWPEDADLLLAVTGAANGYVVRISKGNGYLAKTWIVGRDDDLVKIIAAAIVDMKLEMAK